MISKQNSITGLTDGGGGVNPDITRSDGVSTQAATSYIENNAGDITGKEPKLNIEEFKEAAELINSYRKDIKAQMDTLANNVYSSLNQLNFSIKVIVDINNYVTKYINSEESIYLKLQKAFTENDFVTNVDLHNNVAFNTLFISSLLGFDNFGRLLNSAVSYYLTFNEQGANVKRSLESIHQQYCTDMFIENQWEYYKNAFETLYGNYKLIFTIDITGTPLSVSQQRLKHQYDDYVRAFNNLVLIFSPVDIREPKSDEFTFDEIDEELVPAIRGLITFKNGSILYDAHLEKLNSVISETGSLFTRLLSYIAIVTDKNTEFQSTFEEDNQYLSVVRDVSLIGTDILSSLVLRYPNKDTRQGLIEDADFNKLLTIINSLFRREIKTASSLIATVSKDYKYIGSLETFMVPEKAIDNEVVFNIMSTFDIEISQEEDLDRNGKNDNVIKDIIRLYFDLAGSSSDTFGEYSFTGLLSRGYILTDPVYDALNYFRLFLYPFSKDLGLIFDFLETLYIFDKSITNLDFSNAMDQLFQIKINNVDYKNVNQSKINESLTSRYNGLEALNFFDIVYYATIIKETDIKGAIALDPDAYSTIAELELLFKDGPGYELIMFSLIENILYRDLNLSLVMKTLSIRTNVRTLFFKILFLIAIDRIKVTMNTYYSNDIPSEIGIYPILVKNTTTYLGDLQYLKILLNANSYYNGHGTVFNEARVNNFDALGDNIWDKEQLETIKELFALYKEV